MLTETQRTHGMALIGECAECGKALYAGPLGPAHARWSDERDHTATLATPAR